MSAPITIYPNGYSLLEIASKRASICIWSAYTPDLLLNGPGREVKIDMYIFKWVGDPS